MSEIPIPIRNQRRKSSLHRSRLRTLLFVFLSLATFAVWGTASAETPDDAFMRAYTLIQEGDALSSSNQVPAALKKYQQAENILITLHKTLPNWNSSVVTFRLDYVSDKLSSLAAAPASQPQSSSAAPAKPNAAGTAPAAPDVQVKLLSAGAEPRRQLRLHPKAGDKQSMTMTMTMGMTMQVGEMQPQEMKLPTMTMTMDTTVTEVSDNGDITYDVKFNDATVTNDTESPAAAAMKTALAGLKGMSGTGKLSNRGVVESSHMKVPPGAAPQIRQVMDQMRESFSNLGEPFPEEAIGPGAKWEVMMPLKSQGMTIQQTAHYELVSLEGDTVTTRSTLAQTATNQRIQNPSMPGLKVELTNMTGQGTGQRTCSLGRILPTSATLQYHTDMAMAVNSRGQDQKMAMKMDLDLQVEGK